MLKINLDKFLSVYNKTYIDCPSKTAPFAYWKMIELFKDSDIYYSESDDIYYVIRNKHLITYLSKSDNFVLSKEEINKLECLTILQQIYNNIDYKLDRFKASKIEPLFYDFNTYSDLSLNNCYEVIDFDINNEKHFIKASEIINEDLGDFFKKDNIKKMTTFPSYNPCLWFFIRDKYKDKMVSISISTFCDEVKEVDIDWMYIRNDYQRQGLGRYMIYETVKRSKKAQIIRVSGVNKFYKKCGFVAKDLWIWASTPNYSFYAPSIQPNVLN